MPLRKIDGGRAAAEDAEDLDAPGGRGEPGSHTRQKKPSDQIDLLIAELRRRSEGLEGAALQTEIDAFLEHVIEHHSKAAPPGPLREELRAVMRGMVESDPHVAAVVRELRAAPEH
jgi:hypothetical protein